MISIATVLTPGNNAIQCLTTYKIKFNKKLKISESHFYLPSSEQTKGPPESPSQASALSFRKPAQNMPSVMALA